MMHGTSGNIDVCYNSYITEKGNTNIMTILIAKNDKDRIVFASDTLITKRNSTSIANKIFMNKTKDMIVGYAGMSVVDYGDEITLYIEPIITNAINRYDGTNVEKIVQLLKDDIDKFIPNDRVQNIGQFLVGHKDSKGQLHLDGYQIDKRENCLAPVFTHFYDENSYFTKNDICVVGASDFNTIMEFWSKDISTEENLKRIVDRYITDYSFPTIGGTSVVEVLKK